jgi:hypothetical protein
MLRVLGRSAAAALVALLVPLARALPGTVTAAGGAKTLLALPSVCVRVCVCACACVCVCVFVDYLGFHALFLPQNQRVVPILTTGSVCGRAHR